MVVMAEHRAGHVRSQGPVQSVDRALTILEIIARDSETSLGAISRELGVHKSTASRLVDVLMDHGLVQPPPEPGRYSLGVGCLRLAAATAARLDLAVQAQPVCDELAADLGDTCNVAIRDGDVIINVCQAVGESAVAARNWIGRSTPLHATASGKVLLAHLDEVEQVRFIDSRLEALTARTLTRSRDLRAELDRVRRDGFASALEEYEEGLHAVAAPVRGADGVVVAALSAAGPAYRLTEQRLPHVRHAVARAAAEVSARLGYLTQPTG